MIRALVLALALATQAQAQSGNSGLDALGSRDRILGWEAVGRIDTGAGFCTGTLIATNLVLTAAHCLFTPEGAPVDPAAITFRAGLSGDSAIATAGAARAVAHPRYAPKAATGSDTIRYDVGLIELATAIPAATAAPFVVATPAGRGAVSVVSYARGRENVASWQRECRIVARRDPLMAFDCDVDFGSSGAPVFDRSGNRARIVSLISAGSRDEGEVRSYGMQLPALVAELQAALRSGGAQPARIAAPTLRKPGLRSTASGAKFLRP